MTTLQEAEKIVNKAREESLKKREQDLINWIDSKIGKTFVYRNNSYGNDSPKWDVFEQIIERTDSATVLVERWELINPKEQKFKIERTSVYVYDWNLQKGRGNNHFNDYPSCTIQEFNLNKKKIMKLLDNTTPQREERV